jgi:hypothetical protein
MVPVTEADDVADMARRRAALERIFKRMDEKPIDLGDRRLTRDDYYD